MMVDWMTDWHCNLKSHYASSIAKKRMCLLYQENDLEIMRLLTSDPEVKKNIPEEEQV